MAGRVRYLDLVNIAERYPTPLHTSKRPKSDKQRSLDSYFKVARQAENEETGDVNENSAAINPAPNESVTEAEPALAYSENKPSTSSEILDHPSENPRYYEFVTIPYNDWKNALGEKRGRLALHSNSESHLKALEKSGLLLSVSDQTRPSIVQSISKAYSDKVEKNRAGLLSLIDNISGLVTSCTRLFSRIVEEDRTSEEPIKVLVPDWLTSFKLDKLPGMDKLHP
ncbi:unnamed protein product [Mytilus coruscus]|uniref:Uncharacterized protein n=1 Tax=Mytilus coruscus TaxID=42192 RepID=A0A6J8AXN1_MYTCO|nr:unnamed protein product [Mytilus coruscus]